MLMGIHITKHIPSKGSLNKQIKCEPVTANPSLKLLKLTEIADEPTYIDTIRNKEINQLKDNIDKHKEETP